MLANSVANLKMTSSSFDLQEICVDLYRPPTQKTMNELSHRRTDWHHEDHAASCSSPFANMSKQHQYTRWTLAVMFCHLLRISVEGQEEPGADSCMELGCVRSILVWTRCWYLTSFQIQYADLINQTVRIVTE